VVRLSDDAPMPRERRSVGAAGWDRAQGGTNVRAAKNEMAVELDVGDIHTFGEVWGDLSVRHCDLPAGADLRPLLAGLPGDRCDCPHWGYIIDGSITIQYADGTQETNRAGELYFWPGGHTGWTDTGVVFVEFSPADEIAPVLAHLGAQLDASTSNGTAG
jgi:hypothetical protein